eukprot:COSAG01_NODE_23_length_37704_cov_30.005877_45_plen_128_part_00
MHLAPPFQRLVQPLLATGRHTVEELSCGDPSCFAAGVGAAAPLGGDGGSLADRFVLSTRYCSATLRWHVIFNLARPHDPPEIILPEEEEQASSHGGGGGGGGWAEAAWAGGEVMPATGCWLGFRVGT